MKYKLVLLGIVLCIVLEFLIYNINHKYNLFKPIFVINKQLSYEVREGNGFFTNPLLECQGVEGDDSSVQLNVSKYELNNYTSETKKKYNLNSISIYFRDLNNGPWIGINEKEDFIGGSLLKVPIMIAYLKLAENDSSILERIIDYKEKKVLSSQYFSPGKEIEIGKKYKVEELLNYAITYSDNNAAYILFKNLKEEDFDAVFEALGQGHPDLSMPYPVNTKTYASFFRILFNSSYLNKDMSEKALEILSKVDFNRGLNALIPENIIVSHKFGIRDDAGINQLHDCGIIYYPGHPYLLCIMTKGGEFDKMAESIAQISKFVYDQVSKN